VRKVLEMCCAWETSCVLTADVAVAGLGSVRLHKSCRLHVEGREEFDDERDWEQVVLRLVGWIVCECVRQPARPSCWLPTPFAPATGSGHIREAASGVGLTHLSPPASKYNPAGAGD
jgi:hypothetical protein